MLEKHEQKAFICLARLKFPHILIHGNSTQAKSGHPGFYNKLLGQGYVPGFPDVFVFYPIGKYAGFGIEMKQPKAIGKRGKPLKGYEATPSQIEIGQRLMKAGYAWTVAYGWEDAIKKLEKYMDNLWENEAI